MNDVSPGDLRALVAGELAQPLPEAVHAFAAHLACQGSGAVAVLFYGSNLRTGDLNGVLDFYILVERLGEWHGRGLSALANHVLPPNVGYHCWSHQGDLLRAKVAVLRLDQFCQGVRGGGIDTTLWARFAQPAALAWVRDADAGAAAVSAVSTAITTAATWAAWLGPVRGSASQFWDALFARTYAAELRVEKKDRALSLAAHAPERYAAALTRAWLESGMLLHAGEQESLQPDVSAEARRKALRTWSWRARCGKPLNLLRLFKSIWTFEGGADYVAWKVERHSGYRIPLRDWQRRHPLLAAPAVLWKLWRRGVIG